MRKFLSGVAILALAAAPAIAEQGQGKGNGGGGGGGKPDKQQVDHGGHGQGSAKAQGGGGGKPDKAERGGERRVASQGRVETRGNGKPDKPASNKPVKAERAAERAADRGLERVDRGNDDMRGSDRVVRVRDDDRIIDVVDRGRRFETSRGLIEGCPPGLAKKDNGCMPPGLARQSDPWRRPEWLGFRELDDDYRYYDGYMLRLGDNNQVLGYVPLLGGALALGNPWPQSFQTAALPPYYQDFFDLGPANGYRYYDDTIYRVDPETSAISAIAALLTGDDITVGQPMPLGYEVYNVPLSYRQQYVDGPESLYRYSDGYIYQMDPETRLVQAAIELLL
jgi:hypothetical protein